MVVVWLAVVVVWLAMVVVWPGHGRLAWPWETGHGRLAWPWETGLAMGETGLAMGETGLAMGGDWPGHGGDWPGHGETGLAMGRLAWPWGGCTRGCHGGMYPWVPWVGEPVGAMGGCVYARGCHGWVCTMPVVVCRRARAVSGAEKWLTRLDWLLWQIGSRTPPGGSENGVKKHHFLAFLHPSLGLKTWPNPRFLLIF